MDNICAELYVSLRHTRCSLTWRRLTNKMKMSSKESLCNHNRQGMEKKGLAEQRSGVHSRVGGVFANRGLSVALLQMADVSAPSTSCCKVLRNTVDTKMAFLIHFFFFFLRFHFHTTEVLQLQARCLLVCLPDFGALLPVPAAVGIPGEDALAAALIIRAVSDWELHQFGERGNVKPPLWKRRKKKNNIRSRRK